MNFRRILLLIILLSLPTVSFGKMVALKWKPVEDAIGYELQLSNGETIAPSQFLPESQLAWETDFPAGFFIYRVRGIDQNKRPGAWTEWSPITVQPVAPELIGPSARDKITIYSKEAGLPLSWNPVVGAHKYLVKVQLNGRPLTSFTVNESRALIKNLQEGVYTWSVTSIIEPARQYASLASASKLSSEESEPRSFSILMRNLVAPGIRYPRHETHPPTDNILKFAWYPVDGAEEYELTLQPLTMVGDLRDKDNIRVSKSNSFRVKGNSFFTELPPVANSFRWTLRALANIDDKNTPQSVGPTESTEFKLNPDVVYEEPPAGLELTNVLGTYTQEGTHLSPISPTKISGVLHQLRLGITYRFNANWDLGLSGALGSYSLPSRTVYREQLELNLRYYLWLSRRNGLVIIPSLSPYIHDEFGYRPTLNTDGVTTTENVDMVTVVGKRAGIAVKKEFSDRFIASLEPYFAQPIFISSSTKRSPSLQFGDSHTLGIRTDGIYRINEFLNGNLGFSFEKKSLNYKPSLMTTGQFAVFGSLTYRFGGK